MKVSRDKVVCSLACLPHDRMLPILCRLYLEDPDEAVRMCEALLEEPELNPAVRIGDAFGFLIDHHCQQGRLQTVTLSNHLQIIKDERFHRDQISCLNYYCQRKIQEQNLIRAKRCLAFWLNEMKNHKMSRSSKTSFISRFSN